MGSELALAGRPLVDVAAPLVDVAAESSRGSSLTGGPLASLAVVAPTDRAWPFTPPEQIASLSEGIMRLPSPDDVSLRTDASPFLADAGDNTPAADTAEQASTPDADSAEELPAPAADVETVEGVEVDEVDDELVEGEVIDTYGWGYLGMWLDERFIPRRIEAGGTYGSGSNTSWSTQLNARWKIEEKRYDDALTIDGVYTQVGNQRSNNEWIAKETFDWKRTDGSPWRVFVKGHAEYDEIEKLSFRGTASTGFGYAWLSEEDRKLITRVGPSYTYEKFFSPDKTVEKPELLAELEIKSKLFGQLTLEHKTSAYPAFTEADGIRVIDDSGLLTPIGTSPFWSWKLGLRHQYNNKPNSDVPQNTYQASMLLVYDR